MIAQRKEMADHVVQINQYTGLVAIEQGERTIAQGTAINMPMLAKIVFHVVVNQTSTMKYVRLAKD